MNNIEILNEDASEKSASSYIKIIFVHMIKYKMLYNNQNSKWIDSIYAALNSLNLIIKNKNIYNKTEQNINDTLNSSIKQAIKEMKKGFGITFKEGEIRSSIQNDKLNWKDLTSISNAFILGNWLRENLNPNCFDVLTIKSKLNEGFDPMNKNSKWKKVVYELKNVKNEDKQ